MEISTLELALISFCPHVCNYCPQGALKKAFEDKGIISSRSSQNYMNFGMFRSAIDKVPNHVWIDFSATAEPTFHPSFVEFVNYTYRDHKTIRLYSTLAGLEAEKIKYIDCNFHTIVLHLPDNKNILKQEITEQYINVIEAFTDQFKVIAEVYGDLHPRLEHFRRKFRITQRQLNSKDLITRGSLVKSSNLVHLDTVKVRQGRVRCKAVIDKKDQSLRHNVMNYQGDVFLCCCSAFNLTHKIGNLFTDTYDDLFESDEYKKVMRAQDDPEYRLAQDIMCSSCELSIEIP